MKTGRKFFFRKYAAGDVYYGYGFELEDINGKRVVGHGGGDLGISSANSPGIRTPAITRSSSYQTTTGAESSPSTNFRR